MNSKPKDGLAIGARLKRRGPKAETVKIKGSWENAVKKVLTGKPRSTDDKPKQA